MEPLQEKIDPSPPDDPFFRIRELVNVYRFHNDHIMRGPVCRALGLLELLNYEKLPQSARELIIMLNDEINTIEKVTVAISRTLNRHEEKNELLNNVENYTNK
ncbi:hypothetical protein [Pseudochryseolinea flava]|uniref:Uncharacterized protein n=1 Tax=Pseudochryseolinea flava TaxID=2059302 RepID=A0A364Y1J8_9BACT|nr:hypothetical protein [Pseudochryseolinea flava]RAW00537.1 hypothetical protein DQQ10_13135 [Pseudochryseolinea flava]